VTSKTQKHKKNNQKAPGYRLKNIRKLVSNKSVKPRALRGKLKPRLIIDARSTLAALKQSLQVIENIIKNQGNVLVVSTRPEHQSLLFNYGQVTGEPFFLKWVSGTLTNWDVFSDNVKRFGDKLNTQTLLDWQRQKAVVEFLRKYQGVISHPDKPSLIIFLNAQELPKPVEEAYFSGVPSMGLLSTNGDPHTLTYPIPANDSSLEVVSLFMMLVKKAIHKGMVKRATLIKKKEALKVTRESPIKKQGKQRKNKNNFKKGASRPKGLPKKEGRNTFKAAKNKKRPFKGNLKNNK
jgi:small subunit ribosomal protein S2|tara:strand:- start:1565 stop:2443 length:879 start_codon:yes stop_codon:yes gene_type:complete